jgi:hypothetical protein
LAEAHALAGTSPEHFENMLIQRLRAYTAAKRSRLFFRFIAQIKQRPLHIVDIGGTASFWKRIGVKAEHGLSITMVNNHHIDSLVMMRP